jgi:hypothetical protein
MARVGEQLTAVPGTWYSFEPATTALSWHRCDGAGSCEPIAGATTAAYLVSGADVGHRLEVRETATNAFGPTVDRSRATATVEELVVPAPPPPAAGGPSRTPDAATPSPPATERRRDARPWPRLLGRGRVGTLLRCSAAGPTVKVTWHRDGVRIRRATGPRYRLTRRMAGHLVSCRVAGRMSQPVGVTLR